MSRIDLLIAALVIACGIVGWRAGAAGVLLPVIGGFLFWLVAVFVLRRVGPNIPADQPGTRFVVRDLGLVVSVLVGVGAGYWLADGGGTRSGVSRLTGGILALAMFGLVTWELAPVVRRPGLLQQALQDSAAARVLSGLPPPPIDLDRVITSDLLPNTVADLLLGEPPLRPPPSSGPSIAADQLRIAEAASVQIAHTGCGEGTTRGSGFSIGNGMVVTNAHVVEGSGGTVAVIKDDRTATGDVRAIDHARDLAVVYVPDLRLPGLKLAQAEAQRDDLLLTLGHPFGQAELDVGEASVEQLRPLHLQLKGRAPTEGRTYVLSTDDIRHGNSGGPVINGAGDVVAIVDAGPPDGYPNTYALAIATAELRPMLGEVSTSTVAVGACPL